MGKVKSAIFLALMSLLIAVLCFFSTVSFPLNGIETFRSALSLTGKDITLGAELDDETYIGGGYTATYYPEGVISAKEYEDNLNAYKAAYEEANSADPKDDAKVSDLAAQIEDYTAKYPEKLRAGALYLESEVVSEDKGETVSETYKDKIAKTFRILKARYEALHVDGMKMEVCSEYTLRITLPQAYSQRNVAFQYMAYTGELTVLLGSDEDSATKVFPENKRNAVIGDYLKSFSTRTAADGTSYVIMNFTDLGKELIKEQTAEAASSSTNMYIKVGDETPVTFSISQAIDQSNIAFSSQSSSLVVNLLNSALQEGEAGDLSVEFRDMVRMPATFGANALMLVYIAFALCVVAMAVFFFVRYGLLGFVHLFTYLMILFSMLLCIWAIPFLNLGVGTVLGLLFASVVFSVSNAMVYEYARKEYALGRTMASSVKSAYKKTFWHVLDLHIVLAAIAFIVYGISLTGLSAFAFTFGLGIAFSALSSLFIGRFVWACMMSFTTKKGNFCRFKREEVEDDD